VPARRGGLIPLRPAGTRREQTLFRLRDISKAFAAVQALDGVSVGIEAAEILCIAGENGSGKSTLVKLLAGVVKPDAGTIEVDGRARPDWNPIEAVRAGVEIIYQDFSLFPNLTVAENISFNHELSQRRRLVHWPQARRTAQQALDKVGVSIPFDAFVEQLSVADKQVVAIARALVQGARLIAMDEPTTALTEREVQALFAIVRRLKADGVAVIFISHKLPEIFAICERIVVLRNGRKVADGPVDSFDVASLSRHMLGRTLEQHAGARGHEPGPELLRVESLGRDAQFEDVSFSLRAGEVLGITGLLGSGRTALAKALFGLAPADRGRILVAGHPVRVASPPDAIRLGIGYVPADRLTEGLFLPQSIARNIAVGSLDRLSGPAGVVSRGRTRALADEWVQRLHLVTPDPELPASSLSGGNQQRVVLARWLATAPRILILNGPTVGVDVGSKADIHAIIARLAADGMGVIVISDDIPELLAACDSILVMQSGRVTEQVARAAVDEDTLAARLAG
jgi:simple sugar transport system ATP-binding protein